MKQIVVLGGAALVVAGAYGLAFYNMSQMVLPTGDAQRVEPKVAGFMTKTPDADRIAENKSARHAKKEALVDRLAGRGDATESLVDRAGEKEIAARKALIDGIEQKAAAAAGKGALNKPSIDKKSVGNKKNISYAPGKNLKLASAGLSAKQPPTLRMSHAQKHKAAAKAETQTALLNKKERRELGDLVDQKRLPSVNVVIEFAYKSAKLSDKALPVLTKLGEALSDGRLANSTFVVAGHTDSVGSHRYNQGLSSQRAESVRAFLQSRFNIANKRLVAVGYGEERLKNTDEPRAAENRRVEFINLVR